MWQLLIPVALWLGMVGLGRAELTAAQQRGLQVALEEFHKHPPVQWAFKEIGVDSATDTVSGAAWGGEGRGQEAGAEVLGLEHPVLQRRRHPSRLLRCAVSRRGGGAGHI